MFWNCCRIRFLLYLFISDALKTIAEGTGCMHDKFVTSLSWVSVSILQKVFAATFSPIKFEFLNVPFEFK